MLLVVVRPQDRPVRAPSCIAAPRACSGPCALETNSRAQPSRVSPAAIVAQTSARACAQFTNPAEADRRRGQRRPPSAVLRNADDIGFGY